MKKLILLTLLLISVITSKAQLQLSTSWIEIEKTNTRPQDSLIVTVYHRYPFYQNVNTNWSPQSPSFVQIDVFSYDSTGWDNYYNHPLPITLPRVLSTVDISAILNGVNAFETDDIRWLLTDMHVYRTKIHITSLTKTKLKIVSRHPAGTNTYIENANYVNFFPNAYTDYVYYQTLNLNNQTTKIGNGVNYYFPTFTPENIDTNYYSSNVVISNLNQTRIETDTIRWFFSKGMGRMVPVNNFVPIANVEDFDMKWDKLDTSIKIGIKNNRWGYPDSQGSPYRVGYAFNLIKNITPIDSNVTHVFGIINVLPKVYGLYKEEILTQENMIQYVEVFNMLGQKIYKGPIDESNHRLIGVHIFLYHYTDGKIRIEKKFFNK